MAEKHALIATAAAVLMTLAATCHGQSRFEEDFDDKEKPWEEIAVQLPPAPQQADLVPFYVSATATQSFAIDTRSLTVGQDGVIRYTLVTVSDAGAKNVSYEGIRCATYERKLYAFGRTDGSWSRSRRDQWERIQSNAANRQHAALKKDYFCVEKTISGTSEEIVRRIREGRPLEPQSNR